MGVKAEALTGGFSDAVFDSQRIFKKLMDGMAGQAQRKRSKQQLPRRCRLARPAAPFFLHFATMTRRSG